MDDEPALSHSPLAARSRPRPTSRNTTVVVDLQLPRDAVRKVMLETTDHRLAKSAVDLVRIFAEEDIRALSKMAGQLADLRGSRTIMDRDVAAARDLI